MMRCADHIAGANPLGYLEWHDKAARTYGKGARQQQCSGCHRWYFPWERVTAASAASQETP